MRNDSPSLLARFVLFVDMFSAASSVGTTSSSRQRRSSSNRSSSSLLPSPALCSLPDQSNPPSSKNKRKVRKKQKSSTTVTVMIRRMFNRLLSGSSFLECAGAKMPSSSSSFYNYCYILLNAALYVVSGVTQPLLMILAKEHGLANPTCQLYIGPTLVMFTLKQRPRKLLEEERKCVVNAGGDSNWKVQDGEGTSYYSSIMILPDTTQISNNDNDNIRDDDTTNNDTNERYWPSSPQLLYNASYIAIFDIVAQSLVYTGNNYAGPTIFAIIYSSVTIWAAIYSKFILGRQLHSCYQYLGIALVVLGLAITAFDSYTTGNNSSSSSSSSSNSEGGGEGGTNVIFWGACLIMLGTSLHGLTYVYSEKIMIMSSSSSYYKTMFEHDVVDKSSSGSSNNKCNNNESADEKQQLTQQGTSQQQQLQQKKEVISTRANCAIQGLVATLLLLIWQLIYTLPNIQQLILTPMTLSNTSPFQAIMILGATTLSNLVHSLTFYVTLKYLPGGATSAGILKGLQAVLVFCFSSIFLCERHDIDIDNGGKVGQRP